MKKHEVNRCKRMAMGLKQTDIGEKASVTGTTIARYENGGEVTEVVRRSIEWAYEELFKALDKDEQAKVRLATNAMLLLEARTYIDKVDCINTIIVNAGYILKNETDSMHFGKKED